MDVPAFNANAVIADRYQLGNFEIGSRMMHLIGSVPSILMCPPRAHNCSPVTRPADERGWLRRWSLLAFYAFLPQHLPARGNWAPDWSRAIVALGSVNPSSGRWGRKNCSLIERLGLCWGISSSSCRHYGCPSWPTSGESLRRGTPCCQAGTRCGSQSRERNELPRQWLVRG
jgi:hypothetical protein